MIVQAEFKIPSIFQGAGLLSRPVEIDEKFVAKAEDKDLAIKLQIAHAFADDMEIVYKRIR